MNSSNIYIEQIHSITIQNKYTKWYCNIVIHALERASTRKQAKSLLGYVEGHHILPRCFKLGGENDITNIVYLTAREHIICHFLLIKMFKDKRMYQMMNAIIMFSRTSTFQTRHLTSRQYQKLREYASIRATSEYMKRRWFNNGTIEIHSEECPEGFVSGRIWTQSKEHRKISSETAKNRIITNEERLNRSITRKGIPKSTEAKKNMSLARKNNQKCLDAQEKNRMKAIKANIGKTRPSHAEFMRAFHKARREAKLCIDSIPE